MHEVSRQYVISYCTGESADEVIVQLMCKGTHLRYRVQYSSHNFKLLGGHMTDELRYSPVWLPGLPHTCSWKHSININSVYQYQEAFLDNIALLLFLIYLFDTFGKNVLSFVFNVVQCTLHNTAQFLKQDRGIFSVHLLELCTLLAKPSLNGNYGWICIKS